MKKGYYRESALHFRGVARITGPKLTDDQVREILNWSRRGVVPWDLARHFEVKPNTIRLIKRGVTHRKVYLKWCEWVATTELSQVARRAQV